MGRILIVLDILKDHEEEDMCWRAELQNKRITLKEVSSGFDEKQLSAISHLDLCDHIARSFNDYEWIISILENGG